MAEDNYKTIIEALLFVNEKPVSVEPIRRTLSNLDSVKIKAIIEQLKTEYSNSKRGMRIIEVAGGFQMVATPESSVFLKKFYQKPSEKLSRPTLETMAIIAYKQPATRIEIENIRGVDSSGIVRNLINKGLVRAAGRRSAPGRPFVYTTTRQFLEYFGLSSIKELPKIEQFINSAQEKKDEVK